MKLFQQIIAIFFAGLILINSNGLLVNTHSCISKICADNHCGGSWMEPKEACCKTNSAEIEQASNCCSSETKFIKAAQPDVLELSKKGFTFSKSVGELLGLDFVTSSFFRRIISNSQIKIGNAYIPFSLSISAKNQLRLLQVWRC